MLSSLHIRNYVLIDHLEVSFPDGLIVVSGPTGAGKSILLGALGLLCGAKADAGAIAEGYDTCVVEGDFDLRDERVRKVCLDNDLEYDDGHLIIRRTLSRTGRSRGFVNDSPVSLPVLTELGSLLVDIHSQHDTLLLTSRAYQLSILDSVAGNSDLLSQCRDVHSCLKEVKGMLEELSAKMSRMVSESEYNAVVYQQLSSANLRDGEIAELESEQYQLAHSEQIKELLERSLDLLDASSSDERQGVNPDLLSLSRNLDKLSEYLPSFKDLYSRVEAARIELKDIASSLASENEKTGCDPQRLQAIDDRLSLLYGLLKRHNCASESELIARRDELQSMVCGTEQIQERIEELHRRKSELEAKHRTLCDALHKSRTAAIPSFTEDIMRTLSFMELERAVFDISLAPVAAGPDGSDQVEFLFSGGGSVPVPVAKCASGGELSRIMLALKELMSRHMDMPTMIFDEIDTGISGSVADHMGSVICEMGDRKQVIAITHLPQVAAKGSAHYLVEKTISAGKAVSTIKKLSREERVLEIARMLSGASITESALANARALLDQLD